jgi:hypothetical protein
LRDALANSISQRDVDKLDAKVKADLLVKLEPKAREETDRGSFTLVINGLDTYTCARCGYRHEGAAEVGEAAAADPPPNGHGSTYDQARREHRPFPPPPSEKIPREDAAAPPAPPEPERRLLLDPDGMPIRLDDLPVTSIFPFTHEVP